jgi:hypothetical protein
VIASLTQRLSRAQAAICTLSHATDRGARSAQMMAEQVEIALRGNPRLSAETKAATSEDGNYGARSQKWQPREPSLIAPSDGSSASGTAHLPSVPASVLLALANEWLLDRDAASLARVDWLTLRNLRRYAFKSTLLVGQALRLHGHDLPNDIEAEAKALKEEMKGPPETAPPQQHQHTLNNLLPARLAFPFAPASSHPRLFAAASAPPPPAVAVAAPRRFSAAQSVLWSFGSATAVRIASEVDAAATRLLQLLPRVRTVLLGQPVSSINFHGDTTAVGPKPMEYLSLDRLVRHLPPAVTELCLATPTSQFLRYACCVQEDTLAQLSFPDSITNLELPTVTLYGPKYPYRGGFARPPPAAFKSLQLPSTLRRLELHLVEGLTVQLEGLVLPPSLRTLCMDATGHEFNPPRKPLGGIVLPAALEELDLSRVPDYYVTPIGDLALPDALLVLKLPFEFRQVEHIAHLRLPPRLRTLRIHVGEECLAALRLVDLQPLPATLTELSADVHYNSTAKVDTSGLLLPPNLRTLSLGGAHPDLTPVGHSLTELNCSSPMGDLSVLQAMKSLKIGWEGAQSFPPNLTHLVLSSILGLDKLSLHALANLRSLHLREMGAGCRDLPRLPLRWPPNLEELVLEARTTQWQMLPLRSWTPPDTLTSLIIGSWPEDLPLHRVRWPARLQRLSISHVHPDPNDHKQGFASSLSMPHVQQRPFLAAPATQPTNWPATLTSLCLTQGYSESIARGYLPEGLKELHLADDWNAALSETHFPASLRTLVFGSPVIVDQRGSRGGSALVAPLPELLNALPRELEELHVHGQTALPAAFSAWPSALAVAGDLIEDLMTTLKERLTLPHTLRRLYLHSRQRFEEDGWDVLIDKRPMCGVFFDKAN